MMQQRENIIINVACLLREIFDMGKNSDYPQRTRSKYHHFRLDNQLTIHT